MSLELLKHVNTHYPNTLKAIAHNTQQFLCYLPDYQTIEISGEDNNTFLQNLLSNDVLLLQEGKCQYSCLCNAKGRIIATFHLLKMSQKYILILPKTMVEMVSKKLQMYRLRSKIEIISDTYIIFGLSNVANSQAFSIPETQLSYLLTSKEKAIELWDNLSKDYSPSSPVNWQYHLISNSIADIIPQTSELFLLQQVNIDLVNGVSFKKGCYPGQEIIARLHYLGKSKQRAIIGSFKLESLPAPGDKIYTIDKAPIGNIVSSVFIDTYTDTDTDTVLALLSLKLNKISHQYLLNENEITVNPIPCEINNQILEPLQ